jgi:hypothetical protein
MPDLLHSLHNYDLGHLRIVAGRWGVELRSPAEEDARRELSAALLDPDLAAEVLDALPADARSALQTLVEAGGRMAWGAFTRRFGDLRPTGPGRRDREQLYLHPASPAETLFYRAFLARAFFDTPSGPQEFAYIPDDLIEILKHEGHEEPQGKPFEPLVSFVFMGSEPLGRLATPKERAHPLPPADTLLDDATTLLAALRTGIIPPEMGIPIRAVMEFLLAAGILTAGKPQVEPVREFLESTRAEALDMLGQAWRESETFNELHQLPGLAFEGEWVNHPLAARRFLLGLLAAVPPGKWWSLPAFIQAIKDKFPDFQRPAGEYDSWFIKRAEDGVYLRGFAAWDELDGALVRYFITGPLSWLGLVELAAPAEGGSASAFRVGGKRVAESENGRLTVSSNGRIVLPRTVPRLTRYRISRFCDWDEARPGEYRYRVSTHSLQRAGKQGLKVGQLLSLLARHAAAELPPAFVKALKRWEANGTEARVETQIVLRVTRPEVLEELRKSKAGRFLGETLGPVTAVVKPGASDKVLAALAELGLLSESSTDSETDKRT